jgi:AAA+ ATPase superfamily predicted ATPase
MLTNPYHYTDPIINKSFFFGRHSLISHIVDDLEHHPGKVLCIVGSPSMGKTTLLHQIEQSLSYCLAVFIDLNQVNLSSSEDAYRIVIEAMINCIKDCGCFSGGQGVCSVSVRNHSETGIDSTQDRFIELIDSFEKKDKPIHFALLIDNMDRIVNSSIKEGFLSYFNSLITNSIISNHLSAVFAVTSHEPGDITLCRSVINLRAFDKSTVREMVERGFTHNVENLSTEVFEKTGGHPFLVQYVLHELFRKAPQSNNYPVEALVRKFREKEQVNI